MRIFGRFTLQDGDAGSPLTLNLVLAPTLLSKPGYFTRSRPAQPRVEPRFDHRPSGNFLGHFDQFFFECPPWACSGQLPIKEARG